MLGSQKKHKAAEYHEQNQEFPFVHSVSRTNNDPRQAEQFVAG
jgi:hypothetical protein